MSYYLPDEDLEPESKFFRIINLKATKRQWNISRYRVHY
jgi:hypothetical protein